ncbi:hypothetical protein VPH35_123857 [Triticum aestivum]
MEDAIDLDLDAAAGLASLASSGAVAPSGKGKPRAPRKTVAATKPKKALTPEQRARESAKRKGRRHAADTRDEAAAQAATIAATQQEFTNARVAAATREALYMLGVNPSQHSLIQAAVAAASTGSSAFPRMVMPDSPRASACNPVPGFHFYTQASHLSGECSPEAFQALEAFKVQHNGKCFNLSHCYRVIKDEEKFKAQYAALKARGGKDTVEDVWEGEPARPRGKTNSKEDKRDAATNALIASVDGMMNKKDSREEERRRFKAEQSGCFHGDPKEKA